MISSPLRARFGARRRASSLLDEISDLTSRNRKQRKPAIERRLFRLRREALGEVETTGGPRRWPPRIPDLFPGVPGIPEVAKRDLTPRLLRSAIFHHGGLIVRELLDDQTCTDLVAKVDKVLEDQSAFEETPSRHDGWFSPFEGHDAGDAWAFRNGSITVLDSPRMLFDLIEIFEREGIGRLARAFFGEQPVMLAKKWVLRRVPPDLGTADWHQDGAFMGVDIRTLNVWIALTHCGSDAPSMDIVARRLDGIVETGTSGASFDWSVGGEVAERVAEGLILRPQFAPGDALLFDHRLLHRTDTHAGMTRPRYAIEAWFASPSSAPTDQLPIVY